MLTRAGMYAPDGRGFEMQARRLLADLCYLDERERDLEQVNEHIRGYGKLGVIGPFVALFSKDRDYRAEVASVYAEQFHRLGYLRLERLLDAEAWEQLTFTLRERFDGRDVRRSEVEAAFGPPSLLVDKRILCYVPTDGPGWVFVDCYTEHFTRYVPDSGNYEWLRDDDPLVRAVRHPAADFEAGLILTRFGKVLRWGPGWWLHDLSGLSEEQQAIAAQLRGIEANDPSQALKPPRGHPRREPGT
ncbi:hypothetical protein ACFQX7_13740 [Luedemannella flava]